MDSDIISLQNIDSFGKNFVATESNDTINNNLMNFDNSLVNKKIIAEIIFEAILNYDGYVWGKQGPKLLTKIFSRHCNTKTISQMTREKCKGLSVIPQEQVHAIHWSVKDIFFSETDLAKGKKMLKSSTSTHAMEWNAITKHMKVNKSRHVLLNEIGRKYCSNIFNLKEIHEW